MSNLFWRDFLVSIHSNPWIPRYSVGSLPINIESKHEALGPSLARGKSEVSQLCAGVSARRTSLNSDRQGSLNAPSPKPWGLNIAGSFQTIKPFTFLLFIFSNQQLLNCFAKIPLSNYIPLSLCNKSMVFSEMHRIRQWPFQPTAKKGDKELPTNRNHMGFHHLNHQAEGVILQQLTICQSLVLTTCLHHHLSCQLSQAGIMRCNPPDCWRTCDFNFV